MPAREPESSHLQEPATTSTIAEARTSLRSAHLHRRPGSVSSRYNGKMSSVRRFFCLFVIFDMLFMGLMWLICMMLRGYNLKQIYDQQIKNYSIKSSLVDILFLAICRFLLLWVFYGILRINHWIIVFLTTASTTAFCVAKVFYYNWLQTPQPVFEVLSILSSFILAWGEAWFLDYRVIPQEAYANQTLANERVSLIQDYLRTSPFTRYSGSIENFQSPLTSMHGSLYRYSIEDEPILARFPSSNLSMVEVEKYESLARNIIDEAKVLVANSNWTLLKVDGDVEVHSRTLPKGETIFKISSVFNTSPRNMLNELFYEVENMPNWNPALLVAQRVEIFDEFTDIIYQLSASGPGGLVSSRDFVNLRNWTQIDDSFLLTMIGTEHPNIPKSTKYVRGEHGVSCFMLDPGDNANTCKKQFILNMNLKGWIPQSLLNVALVDTLFDYTKCLKLYIDTKYQSEHFT